MIPYINVPDFKIGPLTLHPFGLLVATGVLVGSALATRQARRLGYDLERLNSFITWMLVAGFIGGHVLDEVFYHPDEILKRPWSLLLLWEGLSSFGGFLGALIGILMFKYFDWREIQTFGPVSIGWFQLRPKPVPILPFADLILAVFPVAWIFGRSGCSTVHDHPGARATVDSILAVAYPTSAASSLVPASVPRASFGPIEFVYGNFPRYDLGLLELMFTVVIAAAFALTWNRRLPIGTYVVVTAFAYSPVRFAMDFLRIREGEIADLRYFNLTFAQWCCIALFAYGIRMMVYMRSLRLRGIDLAELVRA